MNEKLKKISLKLSKRHKSSVLYDVYTKFMSDVKNNKDYFSIYDEKDYIKIIFYIHSILETGGFEWGDGMIKNSWVGNYFEFGQDDFATEECDDCNGNGYADCENCGGSGSISCNTCDGSGSVECTDCEGIGEDDDGDTCSNCKGEGVIDCDDCEGDGENTCSECNGNGTETCQECDGNGEIESSELTYYNTTFITWDKQLINMFMNSFELEKPTSIQDFIPEVNQDKMLKLITESEQAEFKTEVKPDKIYCFNLQRLEETDLFKSSTDVGINSKGLSTDVKPENYTY
jgi:hypothetical protein